MNIGNVVREVTVRGKVQGMDQVAGAYNQVSDAADRTATVTDKASKAQVSAAAAIEKLRLNYQDGYRQQQKFTDAQVAYQRAEDQGLITKKAAAAELANIQNKLGQATNAQKAFGTVTSDLNGRVQASAGAFGVAGAAMSALGPIGIGVAAVLGAVYLAINHMISEANRMGEGAIAMRTFSETTGLSITQLKSLGKAGAEFGVGTDAVAASVDKFTVNMEEARKGTGALFDAVRAIDGGLASELATTKTTAQAWDVLAKARAAASDQSKNALSKAAFGKGGIETGLVLDVTAEAGGLETLVGKQQKLNGLTDDQIKKWAVTKVQIDETQKRTANLMAATYTQEVLDRQLQAAQLEERITRALVEANAQRQKSRSYLDLFSAGVDTNPVTPREAANSNLAAGLSAGQKPDLSGYDDMAKKLWERVAAEKAEQDSRKASADAAARESNLLKEQIGYLGSAATANERLAQKLKELEAARLTGKVSDEAYGRAVAAANLDTAIAKQGAYVSALGASAPIAELVRDKELQLQRQRQQDPRITQDVIDQQKALFAAQQLGTFQIDAQTAAEKVKIDTLLMSNQAATAYTIVQTKVNEAIALGKPLTEGQKSDLQKSADAFAKVKTQGDLYADTLQTIKDSATDVGKSLLSAGLSGANGMNALLSSLDNVAKKLSDKAFDNILSGVLSGNLVQAGVGIAQAGASAVISAFTKDQKNAEALKKAQDEWAKAGPAFQAFLKQMTGGAQGTVTQSIQDAAAQEASFEDQAWKARDVAAINAARAGLAKFEQTQKDQFHAIFDAMIKGFSDGLGPDSPFLKAVNSVKTAMQNALSFIDDTRFIIGDPAKGESGAALARAQAASQSYVLSMLQQPKALSAVETGLAQIHGTANALQGALVQLGLSSSDAAKAINDGVTKAVAGLKTQFEAGLTERLNTANGQSFLNDATRVVQQHQQDVLDAASIGTDPSLVAATFKAEAQQIVNSAGLVGDAFAGFKTQFPDLAGIVVEATTDMSAALKAAADRSLTFQNRLFAAANDNQTLEGQLAAFDRTAQQQRQQEALDGNQAIVDLEAAQAAERLNVIKTYNQKIVDDTTQAAKAQRDALNSTAKTVTDYIAGLLSGTSSTYSPQVTLANAQSLYNANMVPAQSGNADAQAKFPQLADNLEKAARAVYASGQGYQDIKQMIISQGLGLPAVQAATDPVVVAMRDVLNAINAGNLAQATDATLIGTIKAAIDAGNAAQVATALSTYFDAIDTNTSQSIDFNEMKAALGGMVNDTALRAMFTTLDTDNSGAISRLELIKAAAQSTDTNTGNIHTDLDVAGALYNAIVSGSAANVATALSTYFNAIDTNTSASIDFNEMKTALAGMASDAALRAMFTTLDADNSGALDKMELVRAEVHSTNANFLTPLNIVTQDNNRHAFDTVNEIGDGNTILDAIKQSNATSAAQLVLLTAALSPGANAVNILVTTAGAGTSAPSTRQQTFIDQMLTALYKIVVNTWAIAGNTRGLSGGAARDGALAAGGWIRGGTPGVDSVRILAMQDEYMVNRNATAALTRQYGAGIMDMINSGVLPRTNDNLGQAVYSAPNVVPHHGRGNSDDDNAILAELRASREELKALRAELSEVKMTIAGGAQHVREGVDAVARDTTAMKRAGNMRM